MDNEICKTTKYTNKKSNLLAGLVSAANKFDVIVVCKSHFIRIALNPPEDIPSDYKDTLMVNWILRSKVSSMWLN